MNFQILPFGNPLLVNLGINHHCPLIAQKEKQQLNISFLIVGHSNIYEVILTKKFESKYDQDSRSNCQFTENTDDHVKCHYWDATH